MYIEVLAYSPPTKVGRVALPRTHVILYSLVYLKGLRTWLIHGDALSRVE